MISGNIINRENDFYYFIKVENFDLDFCLNILVYL